MIDGRKGRAMLADSLQSLPPATVFERSSSLANAAYDESRKLLQIEFRDQSIYRYAAVPSCAYTELLQAHSKGQYFNAHIRTRYPSVKVRAALP